jgi:hypothetical protein
MAAVFTLVTIVLSILIGGVTLTGSLIAWGKLSEKIRQCADSVCGAAGGEFSGHPRDSGQRSHVHPQPR